MLSRAVGTRTEHIIIIIHVSQKRLNCFLSHVTDVWRFMLLAALKIRRLFLADGYYPPPPESFWWGPMWRRLIVDAATIAIDAIV